MSDLKVVAIVPRANEADHATCIAFLEKMIVEAKESKATSCVCVMLTEGDGIISGWSRATVPSPYRIIGALEVLKHDFMAQTIEPR